MPSRTGAFLSRAFMALRARSISPRWAVACREPSGAKPFRSAGICRPVTRRYSASSGVGVTERAGTTGATGRAGTTGATTAGMTRAAGAAGAPGRAAATSAATSARHSERVITFPEEVLKIVEGAFGYRVHGVLHM